MSPARASALGQAAALGLMLGATAACASGSGSSVPPAGEPQTIVVPPAQPTDDEPTTQPVVQATPRHQDAPSQSDCEPAGAQGSCAGTSCKARVACKGQNDCKGLGNCKTALNDCKGQNECKGKGGCAAHCPR